MQIGSIIAIYFVVWWLSFVAVLPMGTQSHHEAGTQVIPGNDPGAPINPRLLYKLGLATVVAAIATLLLFWGVSNAVLQHYWNR